MCISTHSSSSTRKLVEHSWQASASALSANFVQSTKDHRICAKQQNLTQLCNAFLRHGVLFFARIRKNTTFNWVASKGPIVVGTLQGAYKRNHFEASVLKKLRKDTTIIATMNTSVFKIKGRIMWTTQRNYSPRANMVSVDGFQSVSWLLYRDHAECSFFKNSPS